MPVMRLDQLPLRTPTRISGIDWDTIAPTAARRLRELGFDVGVAVEALHRGGWFGRDPIAIRVEMLDLAAE